MGGGGADAGSARPSLFDEREARVIEHFSGKVRPASSSLEEVEADAAPHGEAAAAGALRLLLVFVVG
jgi:hypothetical protein